MIKINSRITLILFIVSVSFLSCRKDKDPNPQPEEQGLNYTVPETYNFNNVKYSGQTTRIQLLDSLTNLINSGYYQGVTKAQLNEVYQNLNGLFTSETDPAKYPKLSDKTAPGVDLQIQAWFDSVEAYSPMVEPKSLSKKYFITPGGLDIAQLVQKTLMGAVFYYQAVDTYFKKVSTTDKNDSTTFKLGQGTDMEHHWDEAFGYYGAPKDFGTYTVADIDLGFKDLNDNFKFDPLIEEMPVFHAKYSLARDKSTRSFPSENDQTSFRETLMDNFLKGRAAITNKDYATRDAARNAIIDAWERQTAATALSYLNKVKKNFSPTNIDDIAKKDHEWAEGRGFINSLNYVIFKKTMNEEAWDEISNLYGNKPSDLTMENINTIAQKLQQIYGFTDFQRDNFRLEE